MLDINLQNNLVDHCFLYTLFNTSSEVKLPEGMVQFRCNLVQNRSSYLYFSSICKKHIEESEALSGGSYNVIRLLLELLTRCQTSNRHREFPADVADSTGLDG